MIHKTADLPDPLTNGAGNQNLIVFDGECVMCSGFFRMVSSRDAGRFKFATAQSAVGQMYYRALGMSLTDFETLLVIKDGVIYQRVDAFCAAMSTLGYPLRVLSALKYSPRLIKAPVYHWLVRNRYRMFGRYDTCMIPPPDVRARFAEGGL
jgi:predicted DCC family thiol-disulfide oxidoreductase YuxK